MMLNRYKQFARWVLCAAMLFAVSNTVHAIEHDLSGDFGQSHTECHHCSVEHSAAVSAVPVQAVPTLQSAPTASLAVASVAAATTSFQARAPPFS
jgi:hypothetical protein